MKKRSRQVKLGSNRFGRGMVARIQGFRPVVLSQDVFESIQGNGEGWTVHPFLLRNTGFVLGGRPEWKRVER